MGLVLNSNTWHYGSVLVIDLNCCCIGVIVVMNEYMTSEKQSLYRCTWRE